MAFFMFAFFDHQELQDKDKEPASVLWIRRRNSSLEDGVIRRFASPMVLEVESQSLVMVSVVYTH